MAVPILIKRHFSLPGQQQQPAATPAPAQAAQPMQRNPALAYAQTMGREGSIIQPRETGSVGSGIKTVQGPTSADLHTTTQKSPEQRLQEDTAAGYGYADQYGIGKEGSMGRLKDEYKSQLDELLAKQKAGLDGMTPAEMQAAREQGTAGINSQLSSNMSMLGDVAAGNGVRGGSAVGLQLGALQDAQQQSGALSRQLILDNLNQKNIAMDRYGNTLGQQQGVALGVQDANNQSANAEQLARQLAAGNYTSQLDSYRAGDTANNFTQQSLDIAKQQVDAFKQTGGYGGGGSSTPGSGVPGTAGKVKLASGQTVDVTFSKDGTPIDPKTGEPVYGTVVPGSSNGREGTVGTTSQMKNSQGSQVNVVYGKDGTAFDQKTGRPVRVDDKGNASVEPGHLSNNPRDAGNKDGNSPSNLIGDDGKTYQRDLPPGTTPDMFSRTHTNPVTGQKYYDLSSANDAGKAAMQKNNASCIITTEAMRQGLISKEWAAVTKEYKLRKMKREDIQVYWAWADSIVKRMQVNESFARAVAKVLPGTLMAMSKELGYVDSAPLHGHFFFGVYKALNAMFRPIVIKRNGERMSPKAVDRLYRMKAA